jgi:1-acyl-sn-glycerol-3-phosphate acyltransferase
MMKPIAILHSLLVLILALLATLFISIMTLIGTVLFRRTAEEIQIFGRYWGKFICAVSGVAVSLEGVENLASDRSYIFAANHQSQFDIFVLQGYLPYNFRWLAKKELFQVPVWGTAMKKAGYIPVDRSHGRQALKSLDEAAKRIAEGTSVIIFPEGTRSRDGKLQPFKAGGMVLAIKAGVELVPVAISGTFAILPKGSLMLQPGRVVIRIGTPIATDVFRTNQKLELALLLQKKVAAMLGQDDPGTETS